MHRHYISLNFALKGTKIKLNNQGNHIVTHKITDPQLDVREEVGLKMTQRKLSICSRSHQHNAGLNNNIERNNKSFQNMAEFKYLTMTYLDSTKIYSL
jgi:hypothetical protein